MSDVLYKPFHVTLQKWQSLTDIFRDSREARMYDSGISTPNRSSVA